MQHRAPEVVSVADVCLGGLRGRSALVIGPEEQRYFYVKLLRRAGMKCVYQEDTPFHVSSFLPSIQLLISIPPSSQTVPWVTAASIAKGCNGRRTPLLILDLARYPSVEDLAGLLPAVCLYTPDDLSNVLDKIAVKAS
jgi:hypothetical protein